MKKLLPCFTGLILGSAVGLNAQTTVHASLDFETAQYPNNFRLYINTGSTVLSQTSNGAGNDFFTSVGGSSAAIVYDANGATAGASAFAVSQVAPLTVSADVRFVGNSSIGVYIINASNPAQGYLALLNFTSGNDTIRFANDPVPNTAGAGTLGAGDFANNTNFVTANTFVNASLTYSINASNEPVLTMTVGSTSSTISYTGLTAFTNVEVGFRLSSGSATISMDNLNISTTAIPEPSTYAALVGVAVLGLCLVRRRVAR